jgi:mutator protein MutT
MPGPGTIDVAAALVFRDGRLLVTRRPPGKHLAGLWEFPGGKLAPGESWEHALARELMEEVGLPVRPIRLYSEVVHPYPEKTVRLRFFVCESDHGNARPIECDAVEWTSRETLSSHDFPPADRQLIEALVTDASLWNAPASRA